MLYCTCVEYGSVLLGLTYIPDVGACMDSMDINVHLYCPITYIHPCTYRR